MNNITIVSMDNELARTIAQNLALELGYTYIDANLEFEKVLLIDARSSVFNNDTPTKEKNLIALLMKQPKAVVAIENEMFLSNENYKQCNKSVTLLLEINNNNEILLNLQNLLKKYCKLTTKETNIEKIITLLKG